MKKEQEVIISLLKEIDEICRKNKIDYYLSPRLTLCAVDNRPFPLNPLYGVVLMKTEDMERFRAITEENPGKGRALESMHNHKWFPGFYLRYINTDTLCFNMEAGRDYANPGLGVNILPLRSKIPAGMQSRLNTMEEAGWLQLCDSWNEERNMRTWLSKVSIRLRSMAGQGGLARKLYRHFVKRQQGLQPQEYILKRRKQTLVFPAGIFEKPARLTLEGEEFQVPGKIREYLTISYGENYLKDQESAYEQSAQMIVSARVSCEQFRLANADLDTFAKERIRLGRKKARSRKYGEYIRWCWDYACFCGNRMNLGTLYTKKKDYIKNLYKNEDYRTLENEFKPYTKMMQASLEKGEVFAQDAEIFDIYMDVLDKTGKAGLKGKISKAI